MPNVARIGDRELRWDVTALTPMRAAHCMPRGSHGRVVRVLDLALPVTAALLATSCRRRMMFGQVVRRLPADEDASGAHIVTDVNQQNREIAARPEQAGEDEQSASFRKQRRNRGASLRREAGDHFGDEQQHEDQRHEAKQLCHIAQPDVRLQISRANLHDRVRTIAAVFGALSRRHVGRTERRGAAVFTNGR